MSPQRGEVWLVDLGLAAKVRPVLVVSVPYTDADYALICVVPHTTSPRGAGFEVKLDVRGLQPGAFNVQGLLAVPAGKFLRFLAVTERIQMEVIEKEIKRWFGLR
jgi:mRNA interferase MazF